MYKKCNVPLHLLRKRVDLNRFKFETTVDIQPLSSVIGQERAVSSINFALEIDDSGYNLFVTGSHGTGRTTIVKDLLNKAAKKRPAPDDWIFVYNFDNPDEPLALEMPRGLANKFKKRMQRLVFNLHSDLIKAFESKTYSTRKNEIIEAITIKKQDLFTEMEAEATALNIQVKSSTMGFMTIPLLDGKPIDAKDYQTFPQNVRDVIDKNISHIQKRIQEVVRQINLLDRDLGDQIEALNEEVARFVVDNHFSAIIESYDHIKVVKHYLNDAAEDIIRSVGEFIGKEDEKTEGSNNKELPYKLNKYQVNVTIDNFKQKGAPVIYEGNPTYSNLFGRIEKKTFQGYIYSDYTMIKGGSILAANGGYLILDADQLFKHAFVYEALKRALRSHQMRIEDINELYGFASTTALRPQSVPLNLKVVLIGQPYYFHLLYSYDEEFRKIFKVRADFDVEVRETSGSIEKYIQFIARVVKEEGLRHFDREGVAAVIEYGFRLADHQKKISIQFGELVKIIRESSFWAKKHRHKLVSRQDIEFAIEQLQYRHSLVEEKIQDAIIENTINVDVTGCQVGQINGLSVYDLGDYSFGRPTRITINTYIGSKGIISIEREAKMSGKIHDKGVFILAGYFSQKFGASMPLSFSASITFEQSYGMIDGDSASSAELYGILSSLSGIPINQSIAVTGSVNQKGEVQAIGGVNEKIEGFYRVCVARSLTAEQGVIIPEANVKNLLLRGEVVQAVEQGKFKIWAVNNIEDGIRILTGQPCGQEHKDGSYTKDSIFDKVRARLIEFARISKRFSKQLEGDAAKKEENEERET